VSGWFPTVPRSELEALLWHLTFSLAPATYVGDCKYVIDGVRDGVPDKLTNSRSFNADLWRKVAAKLEDHGNDGHKFLKTKAHRSRQEAAQSDDDPIWCWLGNDAADREAKRRAQQEQVEKRRSDEVASLRAEASKWMASLQLGASSTGPKLSEGNVPKAKRGYGNRLH
jgi:hypothetical protein